MLIYQKDSEGTGPRRFRGAVTAAVTVVVSYNIGIIYEHIKKCIKFT